MCSAMPALEALTSGKTSGSWTTASMLSLALLDVSLVSLASFVGDLSWKLLTYAFCQLLAHAGGVFKTSDADFLITEAVLVVLFNCELSTKFDINH